MQELSMSEIESVSEAELVSGGELLAFMGFQIGYYSHATVWAYGRNIGSGDYFAG